MVQVAGFVVDRQVVGVADMVVGFGEKGVDGVFGLGLHQLSTHGNTIFLFDVLGCKETGGCDYLPYIRCLAAFNR